MGQCYAVIVQVKISKYSMNYSLQNSIEVEQSFCSKILQGTNLNFKDFANDSSSEGSHDRWWLQQVSGATALRCRILG